MKKKNELKEQFTLILSHLGETVGDVVFTFPRSCHRQCPTCLELPQPGGPVSVCLQAVELYPSWLFQISLWCHKQAAWTLKLSETPGPAEEIEK